MESSTARSTPAESLRRLVGLRPEVPVLSLYLDLDPSEFGTGRARASAYTSLIDEAGKAVDAYETDHDGRVSLRADVERAAAFLRDFSPKGASGVAIFGATGAGLLETFTLARPTRTRVVVDAATYVTPLVSALDLRDWLIVVVDGRHGRILRGNADHLEQLEQISDHIAGQHEEQSTSDHQRWVEHEVDGHLEKVAAALDEQLRRAGCQRVLVAGTAEIAPRFVEQHMSAPARERLAGRFVVEVPDTSVDEIRRAARECFDDHERRRERELLDRLAERLGRGERAAAGLVDVRAMLEQARVETLLYAEPAAPTDPDDPGPDPGALERAIEDAIAQSGEIVPLRHHPDELAQHGHIAALLRF